MNPELITQAVQEFKTIFVEEFDIELSDQEATKKALELLRLFDCIELFNNV